MTAKRRPAGYSKRRERSLAAREKKQTDDLMLMLTEYMRLHYGNPETGKHSAILYGPTIARLSAAASLRALLKEDAP